MTAYRRNGTCGGRFIGEGPRVSRETIVTGSGLPKLKRPHESGLCQPCCDPSHKQYSVPDCVNFLHSVDPVEVCVEMWKQCYIGLFCKFFGSGGKVRICQNRPAVSVIVLHGRGNLLYRLYSDIRTIKLTLKAYPVPFRMHCQNIRPEVSRCSGESYVFISLPDQSFSASPFIILSSFFCGFRSIFNLCFWLLLFW